MNHNIKFRLRKALTPARIIVLSFLAIIVVGSVLLYLPISLQPNVTLTYIDALFIAISATCVTGLTPVVISSTFSGFGQLILLLLIQFGGIGFMTCMAYITIVFTKRLPIKNKTVVKDLLNLDSFRQFKVTLIKMIKCVFFIEFIGALLLALVLYEQYGLSSIWHGIFLAVSAFCNAGFDLFGAHSLSHLSQHYSFQIVLAALILLGGIGYVVWHDGLEWFQQSVRTKKIGKPSRFFSLHSRIVLKMTVILIAVPMIYFMYFEPQIQSMSLQDRFFNALFQAITLRSAGFYTLDFNQFALNTRLLILPLMFIGGASGGTAGGIKANTLCLVWLALKGSVLGQSKVVIQNRHIDDKDVKKATVVFMLNLVLFSISLMVLTWSLSDSAQFFNYIFETMSVVSTVGISTGLVLTLPIESKWFIMIVMLIARVGIMTFIAAINKNTRENTTVQYPKGNVLVG